MKTNANPHMPGIRLPLYEAKGYSQNTHFDVRFCERSFGIGETSSNLDHQTVAFQDGASNLDINLYA